MSAQEIANEADIIVAPLMDLLDGKLSAFAQCCERTVLKRLLKELWKMAIHTLEKVSSGPFKRLLVVHAFSWLCGT